VITKLVRKFVNQIGMGQTVRYIVNKRMIQMDIVLVIRQLVLGYVIKIGLERTVQYIVRSKMIQLGIISVVELPDQKFVI
jgi:hypothetical protein